MTRAIARNTWTSLALPALLLVGLVGVIAAQAGVLALPKSPAEGVFMPATVVVPAHAYGYRAPGEYLRAGTVADAPRIEAEGVALEIMTYQVTAADYRACVAEGACKAAEPRRRGDGNVPVTGVSYRDATDYAAWLSARTGARWRLPSVAEWSFAAGSKAVDTALGIETDAANPAARWIAAYEKEASLERALATPQPIGSAGVNEFGLADLSGNVWEWTATCGSRTSLDAGGGQVTGIENCGVRYLEGQHRTAMSHFVRDAVAGGCSTGVPPDNLGFRLVRERPWYAPLIDWFA